MQQFEQNKDSGDNNGGPPLELSVQSPQLVFAEKTENMASCAALISWHPDCFPRRYTVSISADEITVIYPLFNAVAVLELRDCIKVWAADRVRWGFPGLV